MLQTFIPCPKLQASHQVLLREEGYGNFEKAGTEVNIAFNWLQQLRGKQSKKGAPSRKAQKKSQDEDLGIPGLGGVFKAMRARREQVIFVAIRRGKCACMPNKSIHFGGRSCICICKEDLRGNFRQPCAGILGRYIFHGNPDLNFSQAVRSLADEASVKELLERARYILMASLHHPRFAHPNRLFRFIQMVDFLNPSF